MGLRLQRHLGPVASIEPGQFVTSPTPHVHATAITTTICCPGCGGVEHLTHRHVVNAGGLVTPAWKCPTATCSFFEWLELGSWGEPT